MKKTVSILLTLCMLLSLFGTFAYAAETSEAVYLAPDSERVNLETPGDYVISGNIVDGLCLGTAGTYNIEIHNVSSKASAGYNALELADNVILNLTVYGKNTFTGADRAVRCVNGSKIIFNVKENSSVTFETTGTDCPVFVDGQAAVVEMSDGSAVPGTEVDGWYNSTLALSNGTPALCSHKCEYVNDEVCSVTCNASLKTYNSEHYCSAIEKDNGHVEVCNYCKHQIGSLQEHDLYYYTDDAQTCTTHCDECDYTGEPQAHVMTGYGWYDDEYCINYCINCFYANEDTDLVKHDFSAVETVEATQAEAKHTVMSCKYCHDRYKVYDKENSIIFILNSSDYDAWEESGIVAYVNGEPVALIKKFSTTVTTEQYALTYDKNASYSFKWINANNSTDFGVDIYLPGKEDAVYSEMDMSEYDMLEEIYSLNMADYTKLDSAMAEIPSELEFYTQASVDALVKAVKGVKRMLPAGKQQEVDEMTAAVKAAVNGLVPTETPTALGVINLSSTTAVINYYNSGYVLIKDDDSYSEYSHDGKYIFFQSEPGFTDKFVYMYSGTADMTFINTNIYGNDGQLSMYEGAKVSMTAIGANSFISQSNSTYAGIEVGSDVSLTINDSDGSIIAIGDDNCAGIGGYHYYSENDDEYYYSDAGDITINGGTIFALSTDDGAGIGGGYDGGFGTITINGGTIYAECMHNDGAGIGVGDDGNGGDIIINGGYITALSLEDDGAGIGGADTGHCDSITINGGTIIAGSDDAAAIGGGESSSSFAGKIIINGGVIKPHTYHDLDECLIGNGNGSSKGMTEDNFVQINGGIIFDDDTKAISPAPVNKNGDTLEKVKITVNEYYKDAEVTLKLSDGSEMKVQAVGTDVRAYILKGETVTNEQELKTDPTASPDPDPDPELKDSSKMFKDVAADKWYKKFIDYAVTYGMFKGTSDTTFSPNVEMTRAQFVQVLANLTGVKTDNSARSGFTDVPSGKWYTGAVKWAAENNIVKGMGGGKFEPDTKIDRQQMCVMLVNYVEKYKKSELSENKEYKAFADEGDIASWAKAAVIKCFESGLVSGTGNNKFSPKTIATRAQGATIFTNFHKEYIA